MTTDLVSELSARLAAEAASERRRRLLVLSGSPEWCHTQAAAAIASVNPAAVLWVGQHSPTGVQHLAAEHATSVLGHEFDRVVFDAWSGFDADAFGAVTGTIHGGGLLLLLTPPFAAWPAYADPEYRRITVYPYSPDQLSGRFLARLVRILAGAPGVARVEEGSDIVLEIRAAPPSPIPVTAIGDGICRTADQVRAVAAIEKVATGRRRRPVVLTSDRGRGKSAALGIAAARLLTAGLERIVITGPRLDAVAAVFAHAARLLPEARATHSRIEHEGRTIEFAPPDELTLEPRPAGLVLVDEAAAIPTPLLEQLLSHYSRIAFATTVHGYEGTGRGFAVRFQRVLDQRTPEWRAIQLVEPIRWAADDPLERLVFRALALDAAPAADADLAGVTAGDCTFTKLERDALAADEATLGELFGLLVSAHYRTRPLDLRHLLDGPNLEVWVARSRDHLLATLLLAREGGFDAATARGVEAGRIRPHGHLLPESLAFHLGLVHAPELHFARVMRIAVHPALQGRGIGTALLARIIRQSDFDLIGSSFGATEELLRFWARSGMAPVRLSIRRGATSGAHSAIVLRALGPAGEIVMDGAANRFHRHLPHMLADPLREMEPGLVATVLQTIGIDTQPELSPPDVDDLTAFAFGRRPYEACMGPVWTLTWAAVANREAHWSDRSERDALIARVLQRRSYGEVVCITGLAGRAEVVEAMRRGLQPWIKALGKE